MSQFPIYFKKIGKRHLNFGKNARSKAGDPGVSGFIDYSLDRLSLPLYNIPGFECLRENTRPAMLEHEDYRTFLEAKFPFVLTDFI